MSTVLLVGRCVLALVFVVAAAGKLADRDGFRRTLREFGVPASVAGPGAVALPILELAVAALLVPSPTAQTGAGAALVLLVAFTLAVVRVLRRGERPDCGCLGRARSSRVGATTVVRNAILVAVAALVLAGGAGMGIGAGLESAARSPLAIVLAVCVVVQAFFTWQLLRQHGRLIGRVRALEARADRPPAPTLTVVHDRPARAVGS